MNAEAKLDREVRHDQQERSLRARLGVDVARQKLEREAVDVVHAVGVVGNPRPSRP